MKPHEEKLAILIDIFSAISGMLRAMAETSTLPNLDRYFELLHNQEFTDEFLEIEFEKCTLFNNMLVLDLPLPLLIGLTGLDTINPAEILLEPSAKNEPEGFSTILAKAAQSKMFEKSQWLVEEFKKQEDKELNTDLIDVRISPKDRLYFASSIIRFVPGILELCSENNKSPELKRKKQQVKPNFIFISDEEFINKACFEYTLRDFMIMINNGFKKVPKEFKIFINEKPENPFPIHELLPLNFEI